MTLIDLPDGRLLDVEISGPDGGLPLLFHHGTPGSVRQFGAIQRAAHARGLRLVTYSRAGYGKSTRKPGRTVADVVADTSALLDFVDAERCVVAGWSGGGPHSLATAAGLPDRVTGALVIAGVAPYHADGLDFLAGMGEQNVEEFGLALRGEADLRPYAEREAVALRSNNAEGLLHGMRTLLPDVDRAVLTAEFAADIASNFAEGLNYTVDGWLDDDFAFVKPWGFSLDEISVPTFLWHGTEDLMVPFPHAEWLAKSVPGLTAHLEQGEGHLSIGIGKLDAMLDELLSTSHE